MPNSLLVDRAGAVTTITINRPNRRNAMDLASMTGLAELVENESRKPEIRALVLTGAGDAFSAGGDLASMDPDPDIAQATPEVGIQAANRIINAILDAPVPVIARVMGPAVGVGASIALAADIVIASQDAYFLFAFTKVGLMPDGGATLLVTAAVGRPRALAMALLANRVTAQEALDSGLIQKVVLARDLDEAVANSLGVFTRGPRRAFAETKAAINASALDLMPRAMQRELEGQSRLLRSRDFGEGARAMLERRTAEFSD